MAEENADKKYGIEDLQRKLYSQEGGNFKVRRSVLSPDYKNINHSWMDETLGARRPDKPSGSWLVKVFIFSAIFFAVALAVGSYLYFRNSSLISNENIEFSIKGPAEIKAGDQVDLQVLVVNKNKVPIKTVQLLSEYPTGTKMAGDINQDMLHSAKDLGEIPSGGVVNQTVSAMMFGKENEVKTASLTLKYRVADSNNFFEKTTTYSLKISASPIDLSVEMPSEINSGQDMTIKITAMSNSTSLLKNILLGVDYPPGFTFKSSNIKPSDGNNRWLLGDMQSGIVRTIIITGTMTGSSAEAKSFHIITGVPDSKIAQNIGVSYNNLFKIVAITKPPLDIVLKNDSGSDYLIADGNSSRPYNLEWFNNLSTDLTNGQVTVTFSGDVVDRQAAEALNGYFSSYNNSLIWDKNTDSALGVMEPGSSGKMAFSLGTLPLIVSEGKSLKNPTINLHITIKGTRLTEGRTDQIVETDIDRVVRINTNVTVSAEADYSTGPFANTGPIPPRVEKNTTYTISWTAANSSNDVKDAVMEAILAPNVSWTDQTSPANENIAYIAKDNKVIWNLGYLNGGVGVAGPERKVSFQVSLRPSLSDVGRSLSLVKPLSFSGVDTFTGTRISIKPNRDMSTYLPNDPGLQPDHEKVAP